MRKLPESMPAKPKIKVTVNGEPMETRPGISIPEFLESRKMRPDRVVVEWNGTAQTRAEAAQITLSEGDRLEIVRIVAGG